MWFFIGLAVLIGTLATRHDEVPMVTGLVPLGVGIAYLVYYFFEGRAVESKWREHDLSARTNERRA